jgi:hypothetical protein
MFSFHNWTKEECRQTSVEWLKGGTTDEIIKRVMNVCPKLKNPKSIEMKLQNCLYLRDGRVEGALSHVSHDHRQVWNHLKFNMTM